MNKSPKSTALAVALAAASLLTAGAAQATYFAQCPNIGSSTGCSALITINPGGSITVDASGSGPYDGSDDSLIGVLNNSGAAVTSLHLTSASLPIFGFEGDGIDVYGSDFYTGTTPPDTGYEGPNNTFTVNTAFDGIVNFLTPLAAGASTYFALEENLQNIAGGTIGGGATGGTVPEPGTLFLLGAGFAGLGLLKRKQS